MIYLAAAIALVVWFVIRPVEQMMWLGYISLPADLLFFWLGSVGWPVLLQAFAIAVCGVVQYGALGALIGCVAVRKYIRDRSSQTAFFYYFFDVTKTQ